MEYDAAYKKKRDILIFVYSNESKRDDKLKQFLEKVTNFIYGRFRKTFKNIYELKYHLFKSLVFDIFNLERNLTQVEKRSLESLVEEVFRYKKYLNDQLRYVDFRGIPRLHRFINLEQSELFVEPKLSHISKDSEMADVAFDISQSNETQNVFNKINIIRSNIVYPILLAIKREYSSDMFQSIDKKINTDLELKDIIEKYSRAVILGHPAIGKSTLLKNYVLNLLEQNNLRLFPILIRLIDYVNYLKNYKSLEEFLDSFFASAGFSSHFVNDQLRSGSCLIALDGLDEVIDISTRMLVARKIDEFVAIYERDNIIIATSRIEGYRDSPLANGFEHFILEKFDNLQITELIDRWWEAIEKKRVLHVNDREEIDKISLTKTVIGDSRVLELARIPLFLKMLCLVYNEQIVLPKNKAELYNLTLDTLLEYWDKNKGLDIERISDKMTITQVKEYFKKFISASY